MRRLLKTEPMRCDEATTQGYRMVRSYDEAVAQGVV